MVGNVPVSFSRPKGHLLEQAALTIGIGILVNYCLMLTGQTITRVFFAGIILALWGVRRFWTAGQGVGRVLLDPATLFSACCIICLLAVYYLQILAEPL